MDENEVTLFVVCDKWFKKGSSTCFIYDPQGGYNEYDNSFESEFFDDSENALRWMKETCNKENEKPSFLYEAKFKFPSYENLIRLIIDYDKRENRTFPKDCLDQNVTIINRIDPDEL